MSIGAPANHPYTDPDQKSECQPVIKKSDEVEQKCASQKSQPREKPLKETEVRAEPEYLPTAAVGEGNAYTDRERIHGKSQGKK